MMMTVNWTRLTAQRKPPSGDINQPEIVIEEKGGNTNFDVMLDRINSGEQVPAGDGQPEPVITIRHFRLNESRAAFESESLDRYTDVEIDERYFRPAEVDLLEGDSTKARRVLGWEPEVDFSGLVEMMVASDLELATQEKALVDAGLKKIEWRNGRPD